MLKDENPGAATRRGNEETALFDIVKTERRERRIPTTGAGVIAAAATHPVPAEGALHRAVRPLDRMDERCVRGAAQLRRAE